MAESRRTLFIDVKVGESVTIDRGRVLLALLEKSGQRARLRFDVAKEVAVSKVTAFPSGATQARKGIVT